MGTIAISFNEEELEIIRWALMCVREDDFDDWDAPDYEETVQLMQRLSI